MSSQAYKDSKKGSYSQEAEKESSTYGEVVAVTEQYLTISEEIGYSFKLYKCINNFDLKLQKGLKISFTGSWSGADYILLSIARVEFEYCKICLKAVNCIKHIKPPPKRRIKGIWKVVHRRVFKSSTRIWFNQGSQAFAYSTDIDDIHLRTMKKACVDDYMRLKGWLGERAILKFACRCKRIGS